MARQIRSDDTSQWTDGFGNGSDGAYSPSTSTDAPIDAAGTGTSGASVFSATNASFAAGQLVLIIQYRGTGAGNYEFNRISSYSAGTVNLAYPLQNDYVSGAQIIVMKQYTSATIGGGVTLTAKAWNGSVGGVIAMFCNGAFGGTGTISLTGKGYRGGAAPTGTNGGFRGEGTSGDNATAQTTANGNGGGGGSGGVGVAPGGAGGGNGAAGSAGSNGEGTGGTAGASAGNAGLTTMVAGGGGGAGGSSGDNSGTRSAGGNGGGLLIVVAKSIDVSSLTISLNGTNGGTASNRNGKGGGGAGGSALLKAQDIVLGTAKITATAGSAGSGGTGANGGAGAVGRIHADYLTSISGTTSPTIDSRQDNSLVELGGMWFGMV